MKRFLTYGYLFVALLIVAISMIYSIGTIPSISTEHSSVCQFKSGTYFNHNYAENTTTSAESTEQFKITDDSGAESCKFSNFDLVLSKYYSIQLTNLNFHSLFSKYQNHLAERKQNGFYLYFLCKVLI